MNLNKVNINRKLLLFPKFFYVIFGWNRLTWNLTLKDLRDNIKVGWSILK